MVPLLSLLTGPGGLLVVLQDSSRVCQLLLMVLVVALIATLRVITARGCIHK
jgi:hypothetical protein